MPSVVPIRAVTVIAMIGAEHIAYHGFFSGASTMVFDVFALDGSLKTTVSMPMVSTDPPTSKETSASACLGHIVSATILRGHMQLNAEKDACVRRWSSDVLMFENHSDRLLRFFLFALDVITVRCDEHAGSHVC